MHILITGSNGQLGSEFRLLAPQYPDHDFIFTDVAELDITDADAVKNFLSDNDVDVIINCAAYTAVEKAETERTLAYRINVEGPENLANQAFKRNVLLVHISTDYVFEGTHSKPASELDPVKPIGFYGATKLFGEKAIKNSGARALIIRTSWLYSAFGVNFVKTMRRFGLERGELRIVDDQIGSPTYAVDLARTILRIMPEYKRHDCDIFHYSNEGVASWYDFACEIIRISNIACTVSPISTDEYPSQAPRPAYSVMSKQKIRKTFGLEIPYWRDSLKDCIERLETPEKNR
ncbi:MAG TPA: dTDP-4-dehydrorhamnose reductase [Bacteroidales bacterium]|nr:dTDP-4-dehydrorhamnose reductase [Bacteroidales bacterium]HPT02839.1 dTDP-4-dehydrorhamnose reductase [Bacteroidales bacterium]